MSLEWDALIQVVVVGLVVGAGIPALFALGVRLLSPPARGESAASGAPATAASGDVPEARAANAIATTLAPSRATGLRLVGAIACFAVIAAAVVTGIVFIVLGGH